MASLYSVISFFLFFPLKESFCCFSAAIEQVNQIGVKIYELDLQLEQFATFI